MYPEVLWRQENSDRGTLQVRRWPEAQAPPGQPPTASVFAFCNLANCQFDGQFSRDPDGSIVSYSWNFGRA